MGRAGGALLLCLSSAGLPGELLPKSRRAASPIKLFWKPPLGVKYRSRRETSGAHLG